MIGRAKINITSDKVISLGFKNSSFIKFQEQSSNNIKATKLFLLISLM